MEDNDLAELTLKMHEDIINTTLVNTKLKILNKIYKLKAAGKSKDEILDIIEEDLKNNIS
jgi:hypothetical protein